MTSKKIFFKNVTFFAKQVKHYFYFNFRINGPYTIENFYVSTCYDTLDWDGCTEDC